MKNISRPVWLLAALVALGVGGPVAATAFASDPTPTPVTTNGATGPTGEQDGANNDLATQVDDGNTDEDQQGQEGVDEQDGANNDLATQVDTGNQDEGQQGEQGQNGNDDTTDTAPSGTTGPTGPTGADGQHGDSNSND
jgi:hypothetical protein